MKKRTGRNIKTGHREGALQHQKSDESHVFLLHGESHKGGNHSGGAGGGKKGRPPTGWEKGDIVRDENIQDSPFPLRIKSSKRLGAR